MSAFASITPVVVSIVDIRQNKFLLLYCKQFLCGLGYRIIIQNIFRSDEVDSTFIFCRGGRIGTFAREISTSDKRDCIMQGLS